MPAHKTFDPDKVAYYEKAGWEAYYDRNWLRAFRLMIQLNRAEFGMSLPAAVAGALDIVRASIAFAPLENNDVPKAQEYLRRYYEKARRAQLIEADADRLAKLEIEYWIVHRQLAIARKQDPQHAGSIEPMVQALALLHAALFNTTPAAMHPSAELRAQAAVAVDRITGRYSVDVAEDWRQVEHFLRQAYRSVQEVTTVRPAGATKSEQQVSSV